MKIFILANTLILAALSPNWLPFFGAPGDAVTTFTTPPEVNVTPLSTPATQTASAENVM